MSAGYRLIAPGELDAGLLAAWRAIQRAHDAFESPYFCPQFTQLVGEVRNDVRIVVIEDGARPAGFFPHQRAPFGFGRPVGGALSDYHGVIAGPAAAWRPEALLRAARLRLWSFDHLVDPAGKFAAHVAATASSPQIDLGAGCPRLPKTEGLARKLAREAGALEFTLHEAGGAALEQLIAWKRAQYRRSGLADAFAVRWTGELLRRIQQAEGDGFAGVCSTLRAGGRLVAAHLGMRTREVLHYWFPAYDPQLARFSTGTILLLRIAEAAAAGGMRTIDLGKGDAPYKQRLMTGARPLREGCAGPLAWLAGARRWRLAAGALRRLDRRLRFR